VEPVELLTLTTRTFLVIQLAAQAAQEHKEYEQTMAHLELLVSLEVLVEVPVEEMAEQAAHTLTRT
jgi:hypothetical protein